MSGPGLAGIGGPVDLVGQIGLVGDIWRYLTASSSWAGDSGLGALTRAHLWISLVSTLAAVALAVPPAVWLAHRRQLPLLSVALVNVGRAVPSFAIVAFVFPLSIRYGFGLGFWPTCVALVALGIPPIFTNTYAGVAGVAPDVVEAARGMGMTGPQVLGRVELPLALPLILTGLRLSAVQITATATLGAFVGYECLGTPILQGLARGVAGRPQLVGGALLVIAAALATDAVIGRMIPRLVRWPTGLR
ncbi:MAG: ABC transporter permease [Acidimicrobiales bacterium]